MIAPQREPPSPWRGLIVVAAIVGGLVVWRALVGADPVEVGKAAPPVSAIEPPSPPPAAPRCEEVAAEPFMIGEPPHAPKTAPAEAGAEQGDEIDDPTAPFAVEVGRGTVFDGGFAIGARRDEKGGAVAMLAT